MMVTMLCAVGSQTTVRGPVIAVTLVHTAHRAIVVGTNVASAFSASLSAVHYTCRTNCGLATPAAARVGNAYTDLHVKARIAATTFTHDSIVRLALRARFGCTMRAAAHVGGAFRVIVRQVIRSSAACTLGAAVRRARLARSVDTVRAVTLLRRALTVRRCRCGLHLVLPSQARRV